MNKLVTGYVVYHGCIGCYLKGVQHLKWLLVIHAMEKLVTDYLE